MGGMTTPQNGRYVMTEQRSIGVKKAFPKTTVYRAVLMAVILVLPMRGIMQATQPPSGGQSGESSQAQGTTEKPGPVMQQPALDELKRIAATLSSMQEFTCKTRSTVEVPSRKTGQFITLVGESEVAMQRPNKLRVRIKGEIPNFDFYYDGTNIAAYAPQNKVYSTMKLPGTIDAMLKALEQKTGIQFPAAELLFSKPEAELTNGLMSAMVVDEFKEKGATSEHLAFMNPGVHWQIWAHSGKDGLPQRLAVTYVDVQNFPRRMVEFSDWNAHPKLTDSEFVFQKPSDAKEIEFVPSNILSPTGREKGR
jgi:hypothetical protein